MTPNRRRVLVTGSAACAVGASSARGAIHDTFIREAFRLRDEAVASGDQPYGAVIVLDGAIVGRGRSQVVSTRQPDAHAERVALWDAQQRLGRSDLSHAIVYATSPPCAACQRALAAARIASMRHGPDAAEIGAPRMGL